MQPHSILDLLTEIARSARRPDLLPGLVDQLLAAAASETTPEHRTRVAQALANLDLSEAQRERAVTLLLSYASGNRGAVRAAAMRALADLADQDSSLRHRLAPVLGDLGRVGAAMARAGGRRLLARLAGK